MNNLVNSPVAIQNPADMDVRLFEKLTFSLGPGTPGPAGTSQGPRLRGIPSANHETLRLTFPSILSIR